jgi:hypothetical protein
MGLLEGKKDPTKINKLKFLIKKDKKNFNCNFSLIFCHQNPGSGLDPDLGPYPDLVPYPDPDQQHWIRCPGQRIFSVLFDGATYDAVSGWHISFKQHFLLAQI